MKLQLSIGDHARVRNFLNCEGHQSGEEEISQRSAPDERSLLCQKLRSQSVRYVVGNMLQVTKGLLPVLKTKRA